MKSIRIVLFIMGTVLATALAQALTDQELQEVQFVQYPGRELPLNLSFTDADGKRLQLNNLFHGTPVLLVPGYFRCRMLCEGVSDGVILALQGSRLEMGKDFQVVFVSIDPKEPAMEARAKRASFLKRYARPGVEEGCNFLTGDQETIKQLTDAIGYQFRYDPQSGEYAHPAGFVVVRPDGKIFRYFMGVSFSAAELEKAIADAKKGAAPPSPIEQLVLLCFHYNPVQSRYGALVIQAVRVLALATVVGLIALVVQAKRSRQRNEPPPQPPKPDK